MEIDDQSSDDSLHGTDASDDDYSHIEQRRQRELASLEPEEDPDFQPSEEGLSSEGDPDEHRDKFIDDDAVLSKVTRQAKALRRSEALNAAAGKGAKRGPRKPVEPSAEFKELHSEATSAFIDSNFERAITLVKQAIRLNPEVFAAHSLLSEIFIAQGQKEKALAALFSGAHTRPRDPNVWLKVSSLILERAGEDKTTALHDVIYCYSRIIEIDNKNYDVRFLRAEVYRELGHNGRAAQEYERLLKDLPYNITALRHLAETYIDLNDIEKAKAHYQDSILYYSNLDPGEAIDFDWSDVNIYIELFTYEHDYLQGILSLRALARWLLGRKEDVEWDSVRGDDREWDADDSPRRIRTPWFTPGQYPLDTYGLGLPLELRAKLGLFRLHLGPDHVEEALFHFEWLEPEDQSPGSKLFDYGDLFREVGDGLKNAGLHEHALRFLTPLQYTQEYADTGLYMSMAECYDAYGNEENAERCYLTVAEYDAANLEARARLAKFYEKMGMAELALRYVAEAMDIGRQETMPARKRRIGSRIEKLAKEFGSMEVGHEGVEPRPIVSGEVISSSEDHEGGVPISFTASTHPNFQKDRKAAGKSMPGVQDGRHIRFLYGKLLELRPFMRANQEEATEDWLDIADAILRDFRSNRVFFPVQRRLMFSGYSREAQRKAGITRTKSLIDEVEKIAGRIQATLGTPDVDLSSIPTDYHGIAFDDWLDVFLEYALVLAGQGHANEAYDALAAAADASVWYHFKEKTSQIHVCWFTCALRLKDEETLAHVARWFMKEYQFVTDTYRLFVALCRICGDPQTSLFHSSPSMKFILRQVKAIDFTLPRDPSSSNHPRDSIFQERASLTTRDESGNSIPAQEMDMALLVLYGHILYAGNSFTNALNYFFRAYALDPKNPVVLLSIGLSYIHHSLKRQSENRHYLIMEGLSFMQQYRQIRGSSSIVQERQEVEFNFARVWQMLGLSHLAEQGFHKCLEIGEEIELQQQQLQRTKSHDDLQSRREVWVESFSRQAAYALQCIYAFSGQMGMAKKVTDRWLVI